MDNDLERSLRLLEDAVPTKGLFKFPTTPTRDVQAEVSFTLAPHEMRRLLESDTPTFHTTMSVLLEDDKSFRGSVIQSDTPWNNTLRNMFTEFADVLHANAGGSGILEVAADLATCCSDVLGVVKTLKSKVTISSELPEERWLENERNNWRLLYVLYQDRMMAQNASQEDHPLYNGTSEKECVKELFKHENLIRESQLVIDWLERNALDRDDPILHHSDWTYGWEHTLHQLVAPDTIAIGSSVDIIKNIHPDAPHTQNLSLHHLDDANEKKLCQRIFAEIRCGNLEGAQELCYNSGHPWRAALLEGWKLFHNPNPEEDDEDENELDVELYEVGEVEGNENRDLWKASAIEYCNNKKLNVYERAAIASLCGCLNAVLPVCASWEDYLWAYMRTIVDIRVESEIRDCIIREYKPLPDEYWNQKQSLTDIFTILETSKNANVSAEAKQIDHVIQKHIILDEIPELINLLGKWSEEPAVSVHSLRFFAHLVIFFENVGDITDRRLCEKVLDPYISKLSDLKETQLVAFYVSKLMKHKQIEVYAKHCETIVNNEERRAALASAEDFNLDVLSTTSRIVEIITNRPEEVQYNGNLHRKLTETDKTKICALDWLLFYEEQRVDALAQTNRLVFKFLTVGKLEAAQLSLNKIPHNSVEIIHSEGDVPDEVRTIVKCYLSYKAYLDAQNAFNEWFKQQKNRPAPPPQLPESAQFTEKIAHKHKVLQYEAETERWMLTTSHAANSAKTLLYNVLLFPEGWLCGDSDAEYLRSLCIPEVVMLLYSVLSESGAHEEAVQLADLLASEKHRLYTVYSKEKLGEVLEKISESSVALLNAKKDPFGNPSVA